MERIHSGPYKGHSFHAPADEIVRLILPLMNAGWSADLEYDPDNTVTVANVRWKADANTVGDLPTVNAAQAAWLAGLMGQHGYTTHLLASYPNPDGTPRYRVADLVAPGQPTRLSPADVAQVTEWTETTPDGVVRVRKARGQHTDGGWN